LGKSIDHLRSKTRDLVIDLTAIGARSFRGSDRLFECGSQLFRLASSDINSRQLAKQVKIGFVLAMETFKDLLARIRKQAGDKE
jgi:hypothetical protein